MPQQRDAAGSVCQQHEVNDEAHCEYPAYNDVRSSVASGDDELTTYLENGMHELSRDAVIPEPLSEVTKPDDDTSFHAAAGIIFGCTNSTFDECFELSMVGLPRKYLPLVESVVNGHTLVFLFNFSDRMLHGAYIATSGGQENMSLTAWKGSAPTPKVGRRKDESCGIDVDEFEDETGSPFPAQCTFDILEEFCPVPEIEFKHVLEYTERQRFKFKLSRWQCRDLIESMCRYDAKLRARRLTSLLSLLPSPSEIAPSTTRANAG
eukprot:CAMPEP_0119328384 /NCGR_PEP_ID=MMETSP1333-20130426/73216_1 /TAXON_ID=418940 /ORGANISM="Scyphosphaera apsteinii, Strain RCC1455" /LENGTH=263 /DNA_ID=CAMNT_0007337223 /DNA_START=126 /DNA_END=917 /DNA_ORIENTATION=+